MNAGFASAHLTAGQLNAIVKKLGGHEQALRFLRGELTVSEIWGERDGLICFSVTSDGTTGARWIKRLENKGSRIENDAKSMLRSDDFKPTSGVTTKIAVLKGTLFQDNERTTENIRAYASMRKLEKPNAEVACLIREKFTDEEIEAMGLWWIVVMHERMIDSDYHPGLLGTRRRGVGRWLNAFYNAPGIMWVSGDGGFAFAVPQVSD